MGTYPDLVDIEAEDKEGLQAGFENEISVISDPPPPPQQHTHIILAGNLFFFL